MRYIYGKCLVFLVPSKGHFSFKMNAYETSEIVRLTHGLIMVNAVKEVSPGIAYQSCGYIFRGISVGLRRFPKTTRISCVDLFSINKYSINQFTGIFMRT